MAREKNDHALQRDVAGRWGWVDSDWIAGLLLAISSRRRAGGCDLVHTNALKAIAVSAISARPIARAGVAIQSSLSKSGITCPPV
jgi:hypothetical protein